MSWQVAERLAWTWPPSFLARRPVVAVISVLTELLPAVFWAALQAVSVEQPTIVRRLWE